MESILLPSQLNGIALVKTEASDAEILFWQLLTIILLSLVFGFFCRFIYKMIRRARIRNIENAIQMASPPNFPMISQTDEFIGRPLGIEELTEPLEV
ncbi:unnamed protein product [Caenorhabditis auriculariae]|uniref:Uncharacterized protein n=1 Tax=Caenorhabditis auriculariae TaxID=2777116 RepID=A0A8S1H651_9PELO|nr:unnamed protein product [Caenorhabditis auriculariae]